MSWIPKSSAWRWIVIALLVALGAALAWKLLPVADWVKEGIDWIEDLGPWGPLAWFLIFACLGTLSFPSTPLYLASGVLFGFVGGAAVGFAGGYTASLCSFLIARHLAREAWESRLEKLPKFEELLTSLEEESFKVVVLARVSPFIPASVKNYGFGLTGISFSRYAAATAIGQLPVAATYIYLGWVGGTAVLDGEHELTGTEIGLLVGGAIASILLLVLVTWHANRTLKLS